MTAPETERQERLQVTAADGTTHRFYTHDEVKAAIAAAMMGAADELLAFRGPIDVPRTNKAIVQDDAIDRCIEILKDHIPTDATAALDTMLAEAEKRGRYQALEEAAVKIINTWANMREIAKTIRNLKGGE